MSSSTETWQLSADQAELYETQFVPAIFQQWAPIVSDAARLTPGQRVLDVACGTGVLARTAADRVGPTGHVTGLDLNDGMLSVARRLAPDITWRQGDATDLPFPAESFDAVLCQSALMFFPDATKAIAEMARVCRNGGSVGVQVYSGLDAQPAYGPWLAMVADHAGPDAVTLLGTYWVHGNLDVLQGRFRAAGLQVTDIQTHLGTARWPSSDDMVRVEIEGSPLIDRISTEDYRTIQQRSRELLAQYRATTGLNVPIEAHVVVARKGDRDESSLDEDGRGGPAPGTLN